MKETEMGTKTSKTGCPTWVQPFIQCAIWRKCKEESRDWWFVTEDPLVSIWCKAYGVRCLSPAEVEQEYRQRVRERRARAAGEEGATVASGRRGTSTDIGVPGKASSAEVMGNGNGSTSKGVFPGPSSHQPAPTAPTAPTVPTAPSAPTAVAPPLAASNNIWSDSNSGWNDSIALQSGFLHQDPSGVGLGFPPMPPTHMMNHNYSAYGQFGPPQNYPVYPNMPGVDPFTGMDYSIGPWDPYDPYQNGNYNYGSQDNFYPAPGYGHQVGYNQPGITPDTPNLSQGKGSLTDSPAKDMTSGFEEETRTGASNHGHTADMNDFSHFDSFDFLDEGDVADPDDIKNVEKRLKEVLRVGTPASSNNSTSGTSKPLMAPNQTTTPNRPPKQRRAHTAPPKSTNNSTSASATPTRKSRGGEPRSANRPRPNMEARGTPSSRGMSGKKRNGQRPVDPDFVKRGEGVLWTP
ncbi:hypothetical protein CJU90_1796 [Yarrowia sp. C11]|nr:hypothetical protein CJU90_1796 [Yarrowia sp. C11]